MASSVLYVIPEDLEDSATEIESQTTDFVNAYSGIYTAVDELRISYKGVSSDEFNQRIQSYKKNFVETKKTLKSYTDFLKDYAQEIRTTESEIQRKANALSSGT